MRPVGTGSGLRPNGFTLIIMNNVADASVFTPIVDLVAGETGECEFAATSIRQSGGRPLGRYRWLVWAVTPIT